MGERDREGTEEIIHRFGTDQNTDTICTEEEGWMDGDGVKCKRDSIITQRGN